MTRRLCIDSTGQGTFFLLVEGGTVTIGGSRKHADTVLQNLRVVGIRCELEVEGEQISLRDEDPDNPNASRMIPLGEVLQTGGSSFSLKAVGDIPDGEAADRLQEAGERIDDEVEESVAVDETAMRKLLLVIDGADQGRSFLLPEAGTVTIGKDRKYADIVLNDLYVSRVNCEVEVAGDKVTVIHQAGIGGTLINGRKISRHELLPGDVLRVGNSHLRLELISQAEAEQIAAREQEEVEEDIRVAEEGERTAVAESTLAEQPSEETTAAEEELPADAPEAVRALIALRDKLPQLAGHPFGNYKLGAVLGRGRCGVVFRAEHQETGQVFGLKVFSPLFPHGDQELTRFARVVKGLLPLRHPNLLSLFAAGKNGAYTWIAREHIEGESLTELFRRLGKSQRLDWKLGCKVGCQVSRALDFARKQHLRHGKITPANILLQRLDKSAKLADLMLGSALEGSRLWLASQQHRPLGELAYLSPEQATPNAFVDELSDLYSLGAVVYHLLTGRPPFPAESGEEMLAEIRGPGKPNRPSAFNPGIPAALDKVVLKMLAKRQEDRYQTPAELLGDLEPIEEEAED
jgi:pSer/pThr/pTyr-binding forkhead associated (FHA) protein